MRIERLKREVICLLRINITDCDQLRSKKLRKLSMKRIYKCDSLNFKNIVWNYRINVEGVNIETTKEKKKKAEEKKEW